MGAHACNFRRCFCISNRKLVRHSSLQNGISRTSETAGPSKADGLKSGSDFDGDKKGARSDEIGLSEIEQLLKGKKFSRQVMHLVVV